MRSSNDSGLLSTHPINTLSTPHINTFLATRSYQLILLIRLLSTHPQHAIKQRLGVATSGALPTPATAATTTSATTTGTYFLLFDSAS